MALTKITDAMITANGVQAAPDHLTGTAAENKAVFDRLIQTVVAVYFNQMVDALVSADGAKEIGFGDSTVGDTLINTVRSIVVEPSTGNIKVTMQDGTVNEYNVAGEGGAPVAGKSTTVTATLLASGWADKEYDLAIDGVTAISNQELLPAIGIGGTELTALQGANIVDNGQEPGVMKLKAMGDVPEVDIPVRVVLRGD